MSYIILAFMISFLLLTIWQWCKSRKPESFESQKYFRVLVDGMRPNWLCRSYFVAFIIRRSLFGAILFFCQTLEMITRVVLFVFVQFLITAYMIVLRPQEEIKERISDVINEVYYFFFGVFLLYFNTEARWSNTATDAYFWILMSNNFVLILIMLISTTFAFIKLIKSCCKKRSKIDKVERIENKPIEYQEQNGTTRNMFNHSLSGEVNQQNTRSKDEMYKSYSNFGKVNNKHFDVSNDNQMRHTQRMNFRIHSNNVIIEELKENIDE